MNASDVVDLTSALIRAPSPSGHESPATRLFCQAMADLGFDEASLDRAGNAVGVIRRGQGPTLVLNGHLDTVPTGDAEAWPHDPLGGEVVDGMVWGRGSVDMKGALAAMAVAGKVAADQGFEGTLIVSGVVQEEVGGLGARFFSEQHLPDLVVLGEPSDLKVKIGHRGRIEPHVSLPGRIAHAAKAQLGSNAINRAARYILAMEQLTLPEHPSLGASSATVTQISSFPVGGSNVVPGRAELTIDYRQVAGDEPEQVLARLQAIDPEAKVSVPGGTMRSENGAVEYPFMRVAPAYLLDPAHPSVDWAVRTVAPQLGAPPEVDTWWFCTDAPHLASRGAPLIGFGPGNPELAHTTKEAMPVDQLRTAVDAYAALITGFLRGSMPW